MQFSTAVRDARANATETAIGPSAIMRLLTGVPPASPADADIGVMLAELALPADWLANSLMGVKSMIGIWRDSSANAAGTVGHFRIYESTGTACHIQGTVTITGGGGNLTLDNPVLAVGQQVALTSFAITEGDL
jgi:hypothetical protein